MSEEIVDEVTVVQTQNGTPIIRLNAETAASAAAVRVDGNDARLRLGETGNNDGDVSVYDKDGNHTIHLGGNDAVVELGMSGGNDGDIRVHDRDGNETVHVGGDNAILELGTGGGNDGDVTVHDKDGNQTIHLGGNNAILELGTSGGDDGDVTVHDSDGNQTIHLGGNDAILELGKQGGNDGDVTVHDKDGNETIHLGGNDARLRLGAANGNRGYLQLRDGDGQKTVQINGKHGNIRAGNNGTDGDIFLEDKNGNERIHLDAETGDIKLSGADCAENFDVADADTIDPGTVLVTGDDCLEASTDPYDPRVAGIVSGAGSTTPGIRLDDRHAEGDHLPVALVGKTYCKVDASYGAIEVGDMLTTSPTEAHAMKADDPQRAFGATLGKALDSHHDGKGLVPVLVALQ